MAKPAAALGAVITTLVMGVELDPAANSAPALPLIVWVTVPSSVAPLKYAALIEKLPNASGSISKPNVAEGTDSVSVRLVTAVKVASTRGVALSVKGGEFQVAQPPEGTVWALNGAPPGTTELNVIVCAPFVTDVRVVPSGPIIGTIVVAEV